MFAVEMRKDAANKRIGSPARRWFLPEPIGSGFRLFVYG